MRDNLHGRHDDVTTSHLDHTQEAVIERSSQDEITRCSDQEFISLPLWYSSDGPILIWDLSTHTHDLTKLFSNQAAAVCSNVCEWPTSMSRSARSSWSHRMIFLSFPPPVNTLPLLISHMQKTLPSWPLIWRLIWNAKHTSIQVTNKYWFILNQSVSTVLINCLHILWIVQQAGGESYLGGPSQWGSRQSSGSTPAGLLRSLQSECLQCSERPGTEQTWASHISMTPQETGSERGWDHWDQWPEVHQGECRDLNQCIIISSFISHGCYLNVLKRLNVRFLRPLVAMWSWLH